MCHLQAGTWPATSATELQHRKLCKTAENAPWGTTPGPRLGPAWAPPIHENAAKQLDNTQFYKHMLYNS